MPEQQGQQNTGGSMRLGAYTAHLREGTQIAQIYAKPEIRERHRHRYEVMNEFVPQLESAGLVISSRNRIETW